MHNVCVVKLLRLIFSHQLSSDYYDYMHQGHVNKDLN
jgi:hypothetical protein